MVAALEDKDLKEVLEARKVTKSGAARKPIGKTPTKAAVTPKKSTPSKSTPKRKKDASK